MQNWKLLVAAAGGVIVLAIVLGVGFGVSWGRSVPPLEKVTLAVYRGPDSALIYDASSEGFFLREGLDVTLVPFDSGAEAIAAMLNGKADFSTAADFVLVKNSFSRRELRVVASISRSDIHEVVARRDRSISEPKDLRGKRVAYAAGSGSQYYLSRFLVLNNLEQGSVETVPLKASELAGAVESGQVDAVAYWLPGAKQIRDQLGQNAVWWSAQVGQDTCVLLLTSKSVVDARPSVIERLVRALAQAGEVERTDPERVRALVARETGLDQAILAATWPGIRLGLTLDQALLMAFDAEAEWMLASGGLPQGTSAPNYLDLVYLQALDAVDTGAITIIR